MEKVTKEQFEKAYDILIKNNADLAKLLKECFPKFDTRGK